MLGAAVGRIGGHLFGKLIVGGELFQHRSPGVRPIRTGSLGDRADDQRHVILVRAGLVQLNLIALSLVSIVGRVQVGRVLNDIAARLRDDDDAALDDFALLLKNLHQRRVRGAAVDLGVIRKTLNEEQHVLGHLRR